MSGIAQAAESRGDWKDAEGHLRDLLKLAPEDLFTHALPGRCSRKAGPPIPTRS